MEDSYSFFILILFLLGASLALIVQICQKRLVK